MDKTLQPPNGSAATREPPPSFTPEKSMVFMNDWMRDRAITVGKFKPSESSQWIKDDCPSFMIINHDRDGNERPDLSRVRYDTSHPACPKDANGKPVKYKLNGTPGYAPVFAPLTDSYTKFKEAKTKWIAEGEGKALALAQLGLPVLGIGGCECWHPKGDATQLVADLNDVVRGEHIYIAGDGDVRTNPGVRKGYEKLMFAVRMRGAIPYYVLVPEDAGEKAGIDDVIARWRGEGSKDVAKELDSLRKLSDLKTLDDFPLSTYDDLINRPFPEWIVDGLVQPGELTAVVGATSCGKSFLVQDLMSSVARGLPQWFGKDINSTGLVVHINFEGKGLATRMKAYKQHHDIAQPFPYFALEQSVILPDEQETDRLIRSIKNKSLATLLPVALVTVDTVNRALGGGDENSSEAMGAFIRAADRIRDAFPKAGILLVHHLGKDAGRGARGHSSFSAAVGGELLVEDNGGTRMVSITKQRDGTTDTQFHFKLDVVTVGHNSKGADITSCVVKPSERAAQADLTDGHIYGRIYMWNLQENKNKPTSREQLRRNAGRIMGKGAKLSKADFFNAVEGAINQGFITETKLPRGGASLELHAPKQTKY
jgi:hypothetical protein